MSNIKINYHQIIGENIDSPFSLDGVGFEPELVFNFTSKESVYWKCPAWRHKSTRTFLVKSPVDLHLIVDLKNKVINSSNLNQWQFDQYFNGTFVDNWCSEEKVTIQLNIPRFIFWTKNKNIWIEIKPHFNTSIKNNLIQIPGWYNLSSWTRPVSPAFDIVDPLKPIFIHRGDPLFELSFYSKNLDDGILLKKEDPNKDIINKIIKTSMAKKYINGITNTLIFKNKQSKCPFHFMWKK